MHRKPKADVLLDRLSDERDHVAIQLSLARDLEPSDQVRISALKSRLKAIEAEILRYKPEEKEKLHRTRMGPST